MPYKKQSSQRSVKPQEVKGKQSLIPKLLVTTGSGPSYAKMNQATTRRNAQQKRDAVKRGAEGPKRSSKRGK
jgi:hypothetical protein